ncbi:MAG: hypothetical protein ACJAXX_001264 [Roseivirga sp.]|jgi:hypothetical protein
MLKTSFGFTLEYGAVHGQVVANKAEQPSSNEVLGVEYRSC